MSEENLTSQDKEELKRRLELLQREYQRTAERLQRAERREAVRRNVQNTIAEQNRLLHITTSAPLEQSASSSSPEQLSNPNVPSDTTKVRFHLTDSSPFSTLARKQSPSRTHRLRSKRSRLRLQVSGRESDTEESQEKTEERWREERGEMESGCEETEKDVERGRAEQENREQTETLKDGVKKNEENLTPSSILQSAAENSSVDQAHLTKLVEVNDPPADQSALRNSPSAAYRSDSADRPDPSSEAQSSGIADGAEKSPGGADFLTSCTLIEGLPFPVEYYVRTTRQMASARGSVDLNAVLQGQLSNGRGRRRSSRGRVTARPSSEKPPERSGCRKRGPRGRRGRGRSRESDSSGPSESLLRSQPSFPQEEPEPIPSPKPSSDPPDPQLHLSRELSPDSGTYPIFRKRRGRAGVSRSQIPASVYDSSHLLPSLTSLTQALRRTRHSRNRGGLRSVSDVQDFHLPDDEFGQLKLERLRSSSNAELLAYSACCRKSGSANISERGQVENESVVLDPLQRGACSESSLSLMFTEPRRAETGNADQSERGVASQTLDNPQESDDLLRRSFATRGELHHDRGDEKHTPQIEQNGPHTLAASRTLMLNLSVSLTSHTQTDHNTSLISLGATPNVSIAPPSSELTPFLLASDQDVASGQSQAEGNNGTPENENVSGSPKVQIQGCDVSEHSYNRSYSSDRPTTTNHVLINVEIQGSNVSDETGVTQGKSSTRENNAEDEHAQKTKTPDSDELYIISELDFKSQTPPRETSPRGDVDSVLNSQTSALPVVSANQREDSEATLSLSLVKPSHTHTRGSPSQHVELPSCGSLRRTHTLKALDGGCVLDVCLVRWPSDDWCVCVAGEWSVCVWKQKAGVQQWSLLHTWTFTQSVISLQGIPDSSALLCVCLGRLEITETRTLYCPSTDGEFSQAELCKGTSLQAVLAVSERRVACCSASGAQQNVQVFTLTQDGRIAETLPLVSTYQSIQTLVAVEREKDALIGWTEHKSLLIWNMKSGQLLQTIHLAPESVSTATCLRGYSYRGALCVLLQQASACHDETGPTLFSLMATNPLTGEYISVRSIATPAAPAERLIDSDVCESALVGVFQSGLAIWNLAGGVACAYGSEPAGVCHLARWAGPNTLLTGYLNGEPVQPVSVPASFTRRSCCSSASISCSADTCAARHAVPASSESLLFLSSCVSCGRCSRRLMSNTRSSCCSSARRREVSSCLRRLS
ncbi:hypothetical protein AMELA_G00228320 [Ameiurus melas]|uniref:Partner and localiser of BRCA2 WD40 domain-containing protein n=1 Tax=Ameiurus melas TaxID=219545 RepID=A0A7J5ZY63_AMEME|nr:hypothetical protein AMELA_G00228320 [Ameiurus melas]